VRTSHSLLVLVFFFFVCCPPFPSTSCCFNIFFFIVVVVVVVALLLLPLLSRGNPTIVGLDTEWFPDLVPGLFSKTAVLQMCFSQTCIVISLIHLEGKSGKLGEILKDGSIFKSGQEVLYDVEKLEDQYGFEVNGVVDLKDIADGCQIPKSSLFDLYLRVTGEELRKPKKVTRSNWEKWPLTPQQISYGALDAITSRDVLFGLHRMYGTEAGGERVSLGEWLRKGEYVLDGKRKSGERSSRYQRERSD